MSGAKVLTSLRKTPLAVCQAYRFEVESSVYANQTQGGACGVACKKAEGSIYVLSVGAGATDYYFPWVPGGLGSVTVPGNAADGTLVLTGPMNGCALYVNKVGGSFTFYHDADGKHMNLGAVPGTNVCKVVYKDYATPLDLGAKLFKEKLAEAAKQKKKALGKTYFGYSLITVKSEGKWQVFATGVVNLLGRHAVPFVVTPQITSFGDG